jgi:RHS repeat-associated protein
VTCPGGATEEYTYYDNNKLHTLTNKKANGNIIDAYNYAYDGAGNRTQILDGHGTTTYTYDVLNRLLITATEPDGRVTTYTYDGSGNRETETVTQNNQSVVTTYQYNEQNRLTATETEQPDDTVRLVDFYYDNNGNMVGRVSATLTPDGASAAVLSLAETEDEAALYDYDVWNNMIAATVDGETTTHTYNGDGLRVSKTTENGLTTHYAYEYTEVVLELDGSGNQKALNVRGHKLLTRVTSAGSSWFMYNGHGDVTALTNGANTVQATYYYDAFGVHREQTGAADNPYRYSGYTFDEESGLYYLKARFYDPELARFMQEDTYRGNSADPLSLNLYTYVSNNPLVYWDPTGHYVSPTDKANLSTSQIAGLEKATADWNKANAAGDKAGMAAANATANAIRASAGYSGGTNGNTVTVNKGNTVKTVVVTDTTNVRNSGTITTVNVSTGATSTINNSGTIGTMHVATGATSTVNNRGTIQVVNNYGTSTINNIGKTSSVGIVNNSGTVKNINNRGSIQSINNGGEILNINNINGGSVGTINNYPKASIKGIKLNEIHSPDPWIPPSHDPFANGLTSFVTDPINNLGMNVQRILYYPEDFLTNGWTSYDPPISTRYSRIDDELARKAGWTPKQKDFNYQGGQVIGFGLSVWIPAGMVYSSGRVAAAGT